MCKKTKTKQKNKHKKKTPTTLESYVDMTIHFLVTHLELLQGSSERLSNDLPRVRRVHLQTLRKNKSAVSGA